MSQDTVLVLVAAAEQGAQHPLGQAVLETSGLAQLTADIDRIRRRVFGAEPDHQSRPERVTSS